jgi:hypothetical protein
MGWLKWVVLILIVGIALLVWYNWPKTPTVITKLELESVGGFAYIHAPGDQELNVAFLSDPPATAERDKAGNLVCDVKQLGVDLIVLSGTITSFSSNPAKPIPANRTFDLKGAVVTFPDLAKSTQPLDVIRGDRPPAPGPWGPPDTSNPTHWQDVKFVPGMRYAGGRRAPDYPLSSLDPNWLTKVDGRVVLTHGVVRARHPSDVAAKDSVFEFKSKSGTQASYKQAITDATTFAADVPSDQIVINLTGSAFGYTQIILKPAASGRPVRLKIRGRHTHQTPADLPIGSAIRDYCAFYELLQPVPSANDQLIPHLVSAPAIAAGSGQPSPGPYCGGEWFPE